MSVIIGRNQETQELMRAYNSKQSQLVAVYGRRRVGKTYLIRELFKDEFAFYHTGVSLVELKGQNLLEVQLREFNATLIRYGADNMEPPTNWTDAFERLIALLSKLPKGKRT